MPDDGRPHGVRDFLTSLEQFGIKLGLEQIRGVLAALEHPHRAYPSIVVAGTNGKGSTAAIVERALRAAGHRTGRYTSPHLVAIEERIAIDGVAVSAAEFDESAARVQRASLTLPAPPSFFEATTALALDVFRRQAVDIAVLEVGLGGRLDATNAVDARAAVITAIDFDHQQHLGTTIEAIAREKAGVIKPGAVVVLADNPATVEAIVAERCQEAGAELVRARQSITLDATLARGWATMDLTTPTRRYPRVTLGLRGRHQIPNAVAAIRLLEAVDARGIARVDADAIRLGVSHVEWPGRLESGHVDGHEVLIDGAHNPAGARALGTFLTETFDRRLPIVLGVMSDKDVDGIVGALASHAAALVCTSAQSSRAATPVALAARVAALAPDVPVTVEPDLRRAIHLASTHGAPVVVAGSLYLAGEVRAFLS